jgi:HK97 family phage prohead protease
MPADLEVRAAPAKVRTAGRKLSGLAAVFDTPTTLSGGIVESIRAGAFRASLAAGGDILALVDHDPARLLARTRSGSLRLTEDALGLRFELDVPETTLGRDVLAMAEQRLLGGMSFGFRVTAEEWPTRNRRYLSGVELVEISAVSSFPAYSGTQVVARSRQPSAMPGAAFALRRRLVEVL